MQTPPWKLREDVLATARAMNHRGLNQGRSGNVSARCRDGFLVTPSGVAYDELRAAEMVQMRMDGSWRGPLEPSSEWRIHRDVLAARPEVGAIVHTHSPHATSIACLRRDIPAFHYMVAVAGGDDIRCAPYATFGTQELSDGAVVALRSRKACLLANHGMIAVGATLSEALHIAAEVETLCAQYWRALQIGEPHILPPDEMQRVIERFATYGKQPKRAS